jgi:transposase-like protein
VTKRIARDPSYRGRRFSAETIELCVRWYITYRLSYRDLAAMMAERGIVVYAMADRGDQVAPIPQ